MTTFVELFNQADGRLGAPWGDFGDFGDPAPHMVEVHGNQGKTDNNATFYGAYTIQSGLTMTGDWQLDYDFDAPLNVGDFGVNIRLQNLDGTGYGLFVGNAVHIYKYGPAEDPTDGTYFTNWGRPGEGGGGNAAGHLTLTHTAAGHFEAYLNGGQAGGGAGLSNADDTNYSAGNIIVLNIGNKNSPTFESMIDNLVVQDFIGSPTPQMYHSRIFVPPFAAQRASQW